MNNEILSIEQLKEMANPIIQIPNFDNTGTINVRVQKPKLLNMASEGRIPNHLLAIAATMVTGEKVKNSDKIKSIDKIKEVNKAMELYCVACLVEPTYEDFKDIMTDDQKGAIFNWGIGEVPKLDSFRKDTTDGTHHNDGEKVQPKAKSDNGDNK